MLPAGIMAVVLALPSPAAFAGEEEDQADEALLREAKVATDGAALLAFFRSRSLTEGDSNRLSDLVRQLGSDDFLQRERASAELASRGPPATPFLKRALADPDPEIARRSRACLEEIEQGPGPTLPAAAVRVLQRRKPVGAVQALLAYAPHAEDASVEDEVNNALVVLGVREGKADPALVAALVDREPARRAAAAFAVGRTADADQHAAAACLGSDPDPTVRYRAALGLVAGHDRAGLTVLVGLVAEAPPLVAERAEEMLFRLAGDQAPQVDRSPADSGAARKRVQAAWERWLREQGAQVDLGRLESATPYLGYFLVVEPDGGTVYECERGGKVRWRLTGLSRPHDAKILPGGRILVSEYDAKRVSERDLQGKILWTHPAEDGRYVERLPNGNTFIATTTRAFEVTPAGREVASISLGAADGTHLGIHRKPNGNIVALSISGHLTEMDRRGRVLRSIHLPGGHWCGVHALPSNHYLAAELNQGRVLELDAAGKIVWQCNVASAVQAIRRPDGRTLICSYNGRRLVEVDRAGKVVWEKPGGSNVWRVHER
jgi:hypothetical protein